MYRISSNNAWVLIPKLTLDEYRLGDGGEFGSRLFNWCNGNNLLRIYWAMSKQSFKKGMSKRWRPNIKGTSAPFTHYEYTTGSSFKELRSCIWCIISVRSLFFLMRLYSGLHFPLIVLEELLFMFPCLN